MAINTVSRHTAYIMDRGGTRRMFQLKGANQVVWTRERDEMSTGQVRIPIDGAKKQAEQLNSMEPGRHELCLFRDDERVWEGPLTMLTFEQDNVVVDAKDITWYMKRRAMRSRYSSAYPKTEYVVDRIARIIRAEMATKESLGYNILSYLRTYRDTDDAKTTAVTEAYEMYVFEHLDSLAAKAGIDYTVVGRALHIWDTSKAKMGQTPKVTEADFLGKLAVSVYGAEGATTSISTDGQGNAGIAGGIDPYYGEIELLATAYDEEDDGPRPSVEELRSQAQRNLASRNPTPVSVRIPDNSTLNMGGVLEFKHLVPGARVPLSATINLKKISSMQKLQNVKVTETSAGETVQVSLYPAGASDETAA